ncbi:DNA-directed RNA polymerase beta subunit [Lacticaseibacillus paracasei]|uniref:DNA-directed RNA polymerase beta subunit n=1 Tax=Lacticaseibacillus paracasei TaxID=1597 RepID=A0ABD6VYJ3_LACPA|nr:DNA-directed RNA polymerase subunit beta [Lacticaseibacillus paracasei]POE40582.1 DNA-directed RNA polymerase beta subunit [Lacticaseibacillus paracasei]
MENNVPREKWLYPDRCMKKWLGWILSDHSAYMEEAAISEQPAQPKPEQSQEIISDVLEDAWENAKIVAVQVGTPNDEHLLPDIEGAVIGRWDDQVYLQLKTGEMQSIDAAEIRNVQLLNPDRWWALA